MVDKAYMADVKELRQLCAELDGYSLVVNRHSVTITLRDEPDGLNDIAYAFPIVSSMPALFGRTFESEMEVCLDTYTRRQVRGGLYQEQDGQVWPDFLEDWKKFWTPLVTALEAALVRYERQTNPNGKILNW